MTFEQFVKLLESRPASSLRLRLPSGAYIPDHFHVTEVGRIDKTFIDCGGTLRKSVTCLLQTWTASDVDHRLTAGKLAAIFKVAKPILESADLPVEIEFGADVAAQYTVEGVQVGLSELTFQLAGKQTACLAMDKCGVGECC